MSIPAIRYVASSTKFALGTIHLQCHVKPGASKQREGIIFMSDGIIEICVSAKTRGGEANKAVMDVFNKALKRPKSNVSIVRGQKSRDKTVAISGFALKEDEESCIPRVREQLERAIS